jgi:hypothetical protein
MPLTNCELTNGYQLGCNIIGGVERVWIGTYEADSTYILGTGSNENIVVAATNGPTVYLFEQDIEFAGLEQTGQYSRENGTVHYESVLSVKFIHLTNDLRNTLIALGRAPLVAVVKSNAGEYYILGVETPGRVTEGVASLGVAMGDMNGADLSVTWKSQDGAYLLEPSVLGTDITIGS